MSESGLCVGARRATGFLLLTESLWIMVLQPSTVETRQPKYSKSGALRMGHFAPCLESEPLTFQSHVLMAVILADRCLAQGAGVFYGWFPFGVFSPSKQGSPSRIPLPSSCGWTTAGPQSLCRPRVALAVRGAFSRRERGKLDDLRHEKALHARVMSQSNPPSHAVPFDNREG